MIAMSRRSLITTAATGLLTATTAAEAQTVAGVSQPQRHGHGGTGSRSAQPGA
jgi:hypothetical protein